MFFFSDMFVELAGYRAHCARILGKSVAGDRGKPKCHYVSFVASSLAIRSSR